MICFIKMLTNCSGKLEDVQRLLDETLSAFGGVNLACFNAGVGGSGGQDGAPSSMSVLDADLERWEWVEAVNFWGVLYGSKLFGKYMSEQALADGTEGHIVNTASMAGVQAGFLGAYSTSKHSVVALTEKLVTELQMNGAFPAMGASVLCPAFVATNIYDSARYDKAAEEGSPVKINEKASPMQDEKTIGKGLGQAMGLISPASVADSKSYTQAISDVRHRTH